MVAKYKIIDWTGRQLFNDQEFDSFDECWAAIDEYLDSLNLTDEEKDTESSEYFVEEV